MVVLLMALTRQSLSAVSVRTGSEEMERLGRILTMSAIYLFLALFGFAGSRPTSILLALGDVAQQGFDVENWCASSASR